MTIVRKLLIVLLLIASSAHAQEPVPAQPGTGSSAVSLLSPPTNVRAQDTDDDHGHAITVRWSLSANDRPGGSVVLYDVLRSQFRDSGFTTVGTVFAGTDSLVNRGSRSSTAEDHIPDRVDFYYRVDAVTSDSLRSASEVIGPVQSYGQWFNGGRTTVAIFVLLFMLLTVWFVNRARKGAELFVRPLAGIEAVDDAIGRATEMGKPLLYLLGAGDASDIATIASLTILGRVARRVAEYQTPIIVPCYDPVVMTVAQEVVKTSYLDAGRADEYREDSVFFITNNQFAYVAAVNGIMLRDLPATNIYMGKFYAESLIFAETGALAGSIQISGTDEIAQIPFFVVACDYALIGEELYAASAYLGREPTLLGTLKAQDYAKAAIIVFAIVGIIAMNFGYPEIRSWFKVVD